MHTVLKVALIIAIAVPAVIWPVPVSTTTHAVDDKDLLVIVQHARYGYINHNGTVVVPPQFFWAADFENGIGAVYVCGRMVSIDRFGKLSPLHAASRSGLAPMHAGGKMGLQDASGRFVIPPVFDDILPFSDGLAAVRDGELWGFVDTTGREVIPPVFKAAYYFREGIASAEDDTGNVLIDKTGKILARGFDQLKGIVAQERVPVSRNEKYGYLDLHGNIVIPLVYDDADSFHDGLAPVKRGEKWGYIGTNGRVLLPFQFDEAGSFGSGLAPVRIGNQTGFINRSGQFGFFLAFAQTSGFVGADQDGFATADADASRFWTKEGAFGYVNTSGKVIWGPTMGIPDHPPLTGWSDEDKFHSCEGVPEDVKKAVVNFPQD